MSMSRGRRAAVVGAAVALALGARAAESGDRLGAVVAARIDMQRQLGEWLTKSLQGAAEPYRIEVAVRLDLRGVVRTIRQKQESASPAVKIGGKSKVKLPGLGMVDGGGQAGPLLPEINIEGGTRVTEQVSRSLETEVAKLTVILFVDPVMPQERRELLSRLAADLAGIDKARGDEVVIEQRPIPPPSAAAGGAPTVVNATLQTAPKVAYEIVAMCLTALVAAAIISVGLSKRGSGPALNATIGGGRGMGGEGEGRAGEGGAAGTQAATPEAEAQRKRREELGAFKALADATPKEVVQVIAEADPYTALAIVDLFGLDAEASKLIEKAVSPQRRLEIGLGLASPKVVTRDQLAQMEAVAGQLLQRVRSRVPLGGPNRLAEFLTQAPASIRQEVLDGVAARDQNLARAARSAMLLFDDLPRLASGALRQVVATVDPATVAVALVGAPEVREAVLGAVSKRLRSILEVEEEIAASRPAEDVEKARRAVEDAMRALQARGELRTRDAEAPAGAVPDTDTAAA
jgi:flagellar motor switch protein FliG